MPKMIRNQVYIEARQDQLLKALAEDLGVTEADLIRHGIDWGLVGMGDSVWTQRPGTRRNDIFSVGCGRDR